MEFLILIINIILAVLLVIFILLQKSDGGALGIGVSQDSFMLSRSAGSFMSRATAIIATFFIITSVMLTVLSNKGVSNSSVLEKVIEEESTDPEIPKSD